MCAIRQKGGSMEIFQELNTYSFQLVQIHIINWYLLTYNLPSRELTYPIPKAQGTFEDDFPFPQVGYVNSLEGITYHQ